jgi:SAM-dependent methyltransferase
VNPRTRAQLLEINRRFYAAHAEAFDRSRGARPWAGWARLRPLLEARAVRSEAPIGRPDLGPVLDIGCGNARFACWLEASGFTFRYTGVDAEQALLDAARRQLPPAIAPASTLLAQDFLASGAPGSGLPPGPFELIVLMGVLHHVPGADWRLALLEAATARLSPTGCLALAVWRFDLDPREERKRVAPAAVGPVLGASLDPAELEPGDALLRFGADRAAPPRYCHAVADAELEGWPGRLGLERVLDFEADGALGIANRYAVLVRP